MLNVPQPKWIKVKLRRYLSVVNIIIIQFFAETYVVKDTSIFFLETSCNSYINAQLTVSPRQACAVESAALMNPKRMVYLLFASPGKYTNVNKQVNINVSLSRI
nr:CAZy families GT32 protein [uncultured bacterium]